jgi:hypothetical protein
MGFLIAIAAIAAVVALWLGILAVLAFILTWAWNLVVPTTFGGPVLDFGAAFALVVVLSVIGNFFRGGGSK